MDTQTWLGVREESLFVAISFLLLAIAVALITETLSDRSMEVNT